MNEQQPQPTMEAIARRAGFQDITRYDAWLSWQYATGAADREAFEQSYLGLFATRAALGQELLDTYGAEERLSKLPRWLREYLTLESERFVDDFAADGLLLVLEKVTGEGGFFAFQPEMRPDSLAKVALVQQESA
jgi:hypothetical protein